MWNCRFRRHGSHSDADSDRPPPLLMTVGESTTFVPGPTTEELAARTSRSTELTDNVFGRWYETDAFAKSKPTGDEPVS
jgi:hypothetical protein